MRYRVLWLYRALCLLLVVALGVAGCKTTNTTTNNTQVVIQVEDVECFTIVIPGIGPVPASDVVDNRDGTVTFGGTTYSVTTSCQANPITNPPPA